MSIKLVRLFPELFNIKPFVIGDHPIYHPETKDYLDYWEEQEKRCIEGLWGLDKSEKGGGWRFCPPVLYYYINFCVIEHEDERNNSTIILPPSLRDVEWLFFYNWFICRGFSGFEDDYEYTCHELIRKLESGEKLNTKEILKLQRAEGVLKPDGSYKKFIHPREYLYKTFDKPLGLPLYANEAKNLMALTPRRQGKSMWLMAILSHAFKFHGATRFDQEYFNLTRGPSILIGSVLAKAADTLKHFSFLEEYQKHNFGAWGDGDEFIPGYFFQQVSGSLTVSNQKSPYRNEYEERINGVVTKQGKGTRIVHVTYEDNPEAAVGQGPIISIIEEVGLLTSLLKVLGANEPGLTRNNKFGSHLLIGTAGNMERIFESKMVFEEPETYKFLGFEDLWENRQKEIGLFIPGYYVDNALRDPQGNQNLEAAFELEMQERARLSKADNSYALDAYMMARPLVPSEMFLSGQSNIFAPVSLLRDQLNRVEIRDLFNSLTYKGELEWNESKTGVKLKLDFNNQLKPIISMKLDQYKSSLKGCIVFYEAPEENIPIPTQKRSLYKIVYDPVRDDVVGTSLAAILVYKSTSEDGWALGLQDALVAEYIGRVDKVDDMHQIAIKLAIYYNAKIMVETNIPDFVRYCKNNGFAHLLQRKPMKTISKSVKDPGNKYEVGIDMTSPALHEHAEQLGRQWLLTEWKTDSTGETLLNLHKLNSPMILQQLMMYTREDKKRYDAVAALKLLWLWLKEEKEEPVKQEAREAAIETVEMYYNKLTRKQQTTNVNYYTY